MTSRTPVPAASPWRAALDLQFARRADRTTLVSQRHTGPLLVQKALYPEGPATCHATVLHPPGGIAAGDSLDIAAALADGSHAVMTTPGATKWYRSGGPTAGQELKFALQGHSKLEWLPRESILYDNSRVSMGIDVELSADAKFLGWEILCFGRRASSEQWQHGSLALRTRIVRDGRTVWSERANLRADSGFLSSPVGLAGFSVSGTLLAAGIEVEATLLKRCRTILSQEDGSQAGVTFVPGVLVARYLGHSSEQACRWFTQLWTVLRPAVIGCDARMLRLWAC
jgi:urease accessory protein